MEDRFGKEIIGWYRRNKRDLPWREEKDPYKIWLSEIILQQTQVVQGLNYYTKFINTYPKVGNLAKATEDEVLKLWQGLGYYSRARNLHTTAKLIVNNYKGVFPKNYNQIRELKGIGDYTAAAIASFAFDLPHAVVDGNVYRLLSRVFGIRTPIDSSQAKKEFQVLANQLLNKKTPAIYNQAIMEFGSQFCKPQNPDCEKCCLNNFCSAYMTNSVSELPVKTKKVKIRNRYFNYAVLIDKDSHVALNKRTGSEIWQGLYEFNLIETDNRINEEDFLDSSQLKKLVNFKFFVKHVSKEYKHILSHQHIYAKFYVIKINNNFNEHKTLLASEAPVKYRKINKLNDIAFPRLIEKFMNDCNLKEIL